jgi:hypothetical protein
LDLAPPMGGEDSKDAAADPQAPVSASETVSIRCPPVNIQYTTLFVGPAYKKHFVPSS